MHPEASESTEIRWFRSGALPNAIVAACEGGTTPFTVSSRVDIYAVGSDPAMGVKLRDGMLEVKLRQARNALAVDGLDGYVEQWTKWSWRGADSPFAAASPPSPWQAVHKRRHQAHFVSGAASLTWVTEAPQGGGSIEATELTIGDGRYYTIGVEALAQGRIGNDLVQLACEKLPTLLGFAEAAFAESFGYPQFLAGSPKTEGSRPVR
jgi:hypothetical protein